MMTREEIIRMAREAGLDPDLWNYTDAFERFAALVAAAEREACAKVADSERYNTEMLLSMPAQSGAAFKIAAAIRARDKQ
jgi:hypothetical protein